MKEKNFQEAARAWEEALKEKPDLPAQVKLNLGHAYYAAGRWKLAEKNYQNAIAALNSPAQKSVACQQIGNLFSRKQDYKSALEWYQKSLLHDPENRSARLNFELAWKLRKQQEAEEKKQTEQQNPEKQKNPQDQNNNDQSQQPQSSGSDKKDGKDAAKNEQKEGEKGDKRKGGGNRDEQQKKDAQQQKDSEEQQSDQQGKGGEKSPAQEGEDSKDKNSNADADDANAMRMDKKKLRESGLTEEQARNMLEAMRQSEVKYLQQRRFRGKNSGSGGDGRRW
jgi:tetratricopeptide (TPR) repeat protein